MCSCVSSDKTVREQKEDDIHCVYQFGLVLEMLDLAHSVEYVYKRITFKPGWHYNILESVEMK